MTPPSTTKLSANAGIRSKTPAVAHRVILYAHTRVHGSKGAINTKKKSLTSSKIHLMQIADFHRDYVLRMLKSARKNDCPVVFVKLRMHQEVLYTLTHKCITIQSTHSDAQSLGNHLPFSMTWRRALNPKVFLFSSIESVQVKEHAWTHAPDTRVTHFSLQMVHYIVGK